MPPLALMNMIRVVCGSVLMQLGEKFGVDFVPNGKLEL